MTVGYRVTIGSVEFASSGVTQAALQTIVCNTSTTGDIGRCALGLGDVSGASPTPGAHVRVELNSDDVSATVFCGQVEHVSRRAEGLTIEANDRLAVMAHTEVEGSYQEISAGFIVRDLIAAANLVVGQIDEGPTFPSYVLHSGSRALRYGQRLAKDTGAELATDGEGRVHFRRPTRDQPLHQFVWARDIIGLDLREHTPTLSAVRVLGEGAGGTRGANRSHWLATDLTAVRGTAEVNHNSRMPSSDRVVRTVHSGIVRSAQVASDMAMAQANVLSLRSFEGHVLVLGKPTVQAGQWVELTGVPGTGHTPLSLRTLDVSHMFSSETGLFTRMAF